MLAKEPSITSGYTWASPQEYDGSISTAAAMRALATITIAISLYRFDARYIMLVRTLPMFTDSITENVSTVHNYRPL